MSDLTVTLHSDAVLHSTVYCSRGSTGVLYRGCQGWCRLHAVLSSTEPKLLPGRVHCPPGRLVTCALYRQYCAVLACTVLS